ncbi:MAG: hypothetical protein P1P82_00770 [Bacteroidales bacterium]|nr:hypothetical protein [Bacteroidales bacterium]MDT8430088.1 hypothetical protein [Bacteroidales bacterium]
MKKIIFFVIVAVFTLSSSLVFAGNTDRTADPDKLAVPAQTENKLSDAEIDRITKRVEEIRNMDKGDLTSEEKIELKNEMKEMRKTIKGPGGVIYIGAGSLLLIIILVILLV